MMTSEFSLKSDPGFILDLSLGGVIRTGSLTHIICYHYESAAFHVSLRLVSDLEIMCDGLEN